MNFSGDRARAEKKCLQTGDLNAQTSPEANIKNAEDALWWAAATITTVGYGDKYPVSAEGRIIATLLMTAGVGL